jgi:hypothetical protein
VVAHTDMGTFFNKAENAEADLHGDYREDHNK